MTEEPIDPKHVGQHLDANKFCDECFAFRQAWTHVSGHNAQLQAVVGTLKTKAGEYFTAGKDDLANAFRTLANEFEAEQRELSRNLQRYINASGKKK